MSLRLLMAINPPPCRMEQVSWRAANTAEREATKTGFTQEPGESYDQTSKTSISINQTGIIPNWPLFSWSSPSCFVSHCVPPRKKEEFVVLRAFVVLHVSFLSVGFNMI